MTVFHTNPSKIKGFSCAVTVYHISFTTKHGHSGLGPAVRHTVKDCPLLNKTSLLLCTQVHMGRNFKGYPWFIHTQQEAVLCPHVMFQTSFFFRKLRLYPQKALFPLSCCLKHFNLVLSSLPRASEFPSRIPTAITALFQEFVGVAWWFESCGWD